MIYLFECVNCRREEVRYETEVPEGKPLKLLAKCDHCNYRLRYAGIVGPEYKVYSTPEE